jgi:rfaE bifunctional protein kinase chain/domain
VNSVSVDRLAEILDRAGDRRVLVVGDLMLDRYLRGSVDRISPEAPVPVLHVSDEYSALGGAANVAANVVSLGGRCVTVGCVGDDDGGRDVVGQLNGLGVDTDGILTVPGRPTTVKTRVMSRRQQIVRVDREVDSDLDEATVADLCAVISRSQSEVECLVLEDYNKGVLASAVIRKALDGAGERGLPSVVDPKRWRFFEFAGATVFKPNARELEEALGEPLRPDDAEWMEAVRVRLRCDNLLLTLGEAGMALQEPSGGIFHVPTVARSVYDVSGAGDTVTAAIAVALAAGASPAEAAVLANHAAAIVVGKAGVQPASGAEVLEQAHHHLPSGRIT